MYRVAPRTLSRIPCPREHRQGRRSSDPSFRAATVDRIAALHRIGTPEEVSATFVFVASSAASLITGRTLVVDGGWTLA